MFVPISSNAVYVASKNVVGYIIAHWFSFLEFPWATKDQASGPFDDLIETFLENLRTLKGQVKEYLFSIGGLGLKNNLQATLDFTFRHHLTSLPLFPLVVETSRFGEIDPTVILHQDSCNMMMTAIVDFSRLLWEDREQLSEDQLKALLAQAAELVRTLLHLENPGRIHLKTIVEFLKIIELNLPGLVSTYYHCFSNFREYASRLVGAFEIVPSLELPHMRLRFVQVLSILVYTQPTVLKAEIPVVLNMLTDLTRQAYDLLLHDLPGFDLGADEGRNDSAAILRIFVNEKLPPNAGGKSIAQLFTDIFPVLSLQHTIGRPVSEWTVTILNAFLCQIVFVHVCAGNAIYRTRVDVDAGRVPASPAVKKVFADLKTFDEHSLWLPGKTSEQIALVGKQLTGSGLSDVIDVIKLAVDSHVHFAIPAVKSHETAKFVNDSICILAQLAFNEVSASLKANLPAAMAKMPQLFVAANLFFDTSRALAFLPAYFLAPKIIVKTLSSLKTFDLGAELYFTTGKLNAVHITKFQAFGKRIRLGMGQTLYNDVSSLVPLLPFKAPAPINVKAVATKRTDVSDLICDYRVAKSELVECLIVLERENMEIVSERLSHAVTRIVALLNFVAPTIDVGLIAEAFGKFSSALPKLYTYRLAAVHLREVLEPLDSCIDDAIDGVSGLLYAPVSPARLNAQFDRVHKKKFVPSGRSAFVNEFCDKIDRILREVKPGEAQALYDSLEKLEDNEINELDFALSTLTEESQQVLVPLLSNNYPKYVKQLEGALDVVDYSDTFIWFKKAVVEIVSSLKTQDSRPEAVEAVQALVRDIDTEGSIAKVAKNIDEAVAKLSISELEKLKAKCDKVQKILPELTKARDRLLQQLNEGQDVENFALAYHAAVRHIAGVFFAEFFVQDWDAAPFVTLCKTLLEPLGTYYSSESVSQTLISARRLMRSIRLTKFSAQPTFVTTADRLLSRLEVTLRDIYAGRQRQTEAVLAKQKEIVGGFVETLKKLGEGNIQTFILRLMRNLELDLATRRTFDSGALSQSVAVLFTELSSSDRSVQIKALIHWVQGLEKDVLPVDYDRLLEILQGLIKSLELPDEAVFAYDQDALIDLAVQLSNALAALSALRDSLALVKDMHKLFPIRAPVIKAVTTVMRTLEAYAEEIQTFPIQVHPVLGVSTSIPVMCQALHAMVQSSFIMTFKPEQAERAVQAIKHFIASCPKTITETMDSVMQEPIKVIATFAHPK
jgi:hypothetical protein